MIPVSLQQTGTADMTRRPLGTANRRLHVLVVEDDAAIRASIESIVAAEGQRCQSMASCEVLGNEPYDVLVLDLTTMGTGCFELLHRLREQRPRLPVVLVSVPAELEPPLRSLGLDADNFVANPFDMALIRQAVRTAIAACLDQSPEPTDTAAGAAADRAPGAARLTPKASPATAGAGKIIVVASQKGGTGKSTTAMHVIVALLHKGLRVASIDFDQPQKTLTRYIDNRRLTNQQQSFGLPLPAHHIESHEDEDNAEALEATVQELAATCDYLVIDTPGSAWPLSALVHSWADTLITPINDSFIDLDVIAELDGSTEQVMAWGPYGRLVQDARDRRRQRGASALKWIVVRNRLSNLKSRNKCAMADALERMSGPLGFENGAGLSERVIYRELFPRGLTLLDLREKGTKVKLSMSHLAARQELRSLIKAILG